jgi:AraC-like DNA-binding protein
MRRDGEGCAKCGSKKSLEFHHVRYQEFPTLDDLVLWCHECHMSETLEARGFKRRAGMSKAQIRKAQRDEKKLKC